MSKVYCNKCLKKLGLEKESGLMTLYVGIKCARCGKVLVEEDKNGEWKYNW